MTTTMPWSLQKSVVLTLLIAVAPASFAADLFRWVDKKGNVHYTDRVPPEYVQNGYRVINQQGLTITTISAKKDDPDQKVSAEAKAQLERDRRLLTIYSNADEINATRDRKLAEIKNGISLRQDTLTLLERQFRDQTREAGDYEKQNEAVPETLVANINTTKKKINAYQDAIKQQQQLLLDTHKQYGEELQRYKKISQAVEQNSSSE
ncbi:MAG: DUF4124 domain-containing protein [Pseudomonadota bacterium]|nr:DUF4124 domain-containing protein [Pseudomonadota bacterium]